MKKKLFVLFILSSFLFFSCTKPSCPGYNCLNGGLKEGGGSNCTCICASGYMGNHCETEARQAYLGNYSAQCYDVNGFGCGSFTMQVTASTDSISAINVNLKSVTLLGDIDFRNANISIPSQTISGATYSGSGLFQSGTIVLTVNAVSGGVASTCYYQGPKE